jgi:arylsulfatase A-like enzyme
MAAAEATQPRPPVGAAGLAAALILAKAVAVTGHPWPHPPIGVVAYFWQDAAVALAFAAVERIAPATLSKALFGVALILVAVNVPVARVLGAPMTWTMWRAAGLAMADSASHELTLANGVAMALVAGAGLVVRHLVANRRWTVPVLVTLAAIVVAGGWAATRIDTVGRDRNALTALLPTAVRVVAAPPAGVDLYQSPYVATPSDDLRFLAGRARGMNIVMVALESTAARYLRLYGADADPMPHLGALARDGVVFDAAYAVYPESIRELFATLCGRAPAFHEDAEADAAMPCDAFPGRLARAGYRTALFHSGRFDYLGMRAVVAGRGFDVAEDAASIGGQVHSSFGVDESATVARMLAWIDAADTSRPFFLLYLPIAGHHPYATRAPGPFSAARDSGDPVPGVNRPEAAQYLNALHEGDATLGALLAGLRARGLDSKTMVVAFGDHGEAFGQHDGNSGHSLYIYDENVRVPLVISVPGATSSTRVRRPVSIADVAPTVLDLVGLGSVTDRARSMLAPGPRLAFFFTDYSRPWVGLRDGCWTYLLDMASRRSQLYEVCRDPDERVDRSSTDADRVERYRVRAEQWLATTGSVRPPSG